MDHCLFFNVLCHCFFCLDGKQNYNEENLSLFACNLDYSLFKEECTADEFYKWPIVIGY